MTPGLAIAVLWIGWAASWLLAALWSNPAASRAGLGREYLYRATLIVGGILLAFPRRVPQAWNARMWPLPPAWGWTAVVLIAFGFLFTWWARLHLGTLWSSNVTRKEGHHIVDTGPYGLVRHPIYTGLLLALAVTAATKATALALIGFVIIVAGILMKARLEERFLREELGAAEYDAYAARVPMLVPFTKRRTANGV